jgi:hypothetical protein
VREGLSRGLVVAGDAAPADGNAGAQDQLVVANSLATGKAHRPRGRIDGDGRVAHMLDAALHQAVVGVGDLRQRAPAGQEQVAVGAGDELALGLDQRHVELGILDAGEARRRSAAEAAPDDDEPRRSLRAERGGGRQRRCRRHGAEAAPGDAGHASRASHGSHGSHGDAPHFNLEK